LEEKGGLVKIECGNLECANEIKSRTSGTIRGTILGKEEKLLLETGNW